MPTLTGIPTLSDRVIPAVPGEFYRYTSEFTIEKPIFVLMKCKANKNRPVEQLPILSSEANIFFHFDGSAQFKAYSVKTALAMGFVDSYVGEQPLGETWLASSHLTAEEFHDASSRRDVKKLIGVCRGACLERQTVVELQEGLVVIMMTSDNKYGMFLVQEMTPSSVWIDACHILL